MNRRAGGAEPRRISIVVAVYNPGASIQLPVDSFLHQTMPAEDFEVIFVDDGSTDGTGARIDGLVRRHSNFRVIHIPNSGWPGRPRNLGIEAATGRYVLFVDHDDWLEDDALEYLWAVAEANGADVVAPREVGHGFGVPRRMFRRTIADARLGRDDILALLTPHKLFRRSMLLEHDIRFPEGPRRLEDHHFVIQAYFHARRITITGDHPVYHWAKRDEGANATGMSFDRRLYYDNLRDILDIVDGHTEPGELRDRLYAHWLRYKMVHKLLRPRFRDPTAGARALYDEVRRMLLERVPPAVDRHLPVGYRLVARAVRADRFDLVVAAARLANGLRLELTTARTELLEGRLTLVLDYALVDNEGTTLRLRRDAGRLTWRPPAALVAGLDLDAGDLAVGDSTGELALVARQRGTGLDHDDPAPLPVRARDAGQAELAGSAELRLDAATFGAGGPLPDGTWDLLVQVEFGGFRASRGVPVADVTSVGGSAHVRPYRTTAGQLAIRIGSGEAVAVRAARRVAELVPRDAVPERARRLVRRWLPGPGRRVLRRLARRIGS